MPSRLLIAVVIAACSSSSSPKEPGGAPAPSTQPGSIAQFIPGDATSVLAWRPTEFPVLSIVDSGPQMMACWRALEERITGAYQIFTTPGHSISVLEGDLPREAVEPCVELSLGYSRLATTDLRHDGALSAIDTKLGTIYAGWHGRFVVLGNRDGVTAALAATATPAWRDAIADLPRVDAVAPTAFAGVSFDQTFAGLLDVPTTRWTLSVDHAPKPWPARKLLKDGGDALEEFGQEQEAIAKRKALGLPPEAPDVPAPLPPPVFAGRVELRYATAADAASAAHALEKGAFAFSLEANLAAALAHLPHTVTGTTLVIRFDQTSFANLELAKLQAWLARAQAAAAAH